ncbi:MAG: multicopper oxidase family protein [Burkholderiaceae bacterium]|nr:multicopper oxidase family protein [Burkholderiaceae bacterium]
MKRRDLLLSALGGVSTAGLSGCQAMATRPQSTASAAVGPGSRRLRAGAHALSAAEQPALPVWAYEGQVPGPVLRLRRGDVLDLTLENALRDPTTVHWHGVRVPNAMDGVPHLTQPPVMPGETFRYRFALPDAGTYWYHPHWGTPEQVERGLAGALVVEDDLPPPVDRDEVWLLDDWRLDASGRIAEDFYAFRDVAHAGRLGQRLTVNGAVEPTLALQAGQRLRLRLVNAANARIFALELPGLPAWLIARDGMPADAAVAWEGPLLLGPGMRADLVIDAAQAGRFTLRDRFGRGERLLAHLQVDGKAPTGAARPAPQPAAHEPLPAPTSTDAWMQPLVFGGGMMGMGGWPEDSPAARDARRQRRLAGSREADPVWTVNGHAHMGRHDAHPPLFSVPRGRTIRLQLANRTAWWHPIHVHGHHVKLLARNGEALPVQPWRDTVLLSPRDTAELAFVADNPGRWLIHCHVLEHHAGGMGAMFEVS